MIELLLTVDNVERQLLNFDCEYYHPVFLFLAQWHNPYDAKHRPEDIKYCPYAKDAIGGTLSLEFESTRDDGFFYKWLFSRSRKHGAITVHPGIKPPYKIEFWDCYCVHFMEQMDSMAVSQMTTRLVLTSNIINPRGSVDIDTTKIR